MGQLARVVNQGADLAGTQGGREVVELSRQAVGILGQGSFITPRQLVSSLAQCLGNPFDARGGHVLLFAQELCGLLLCDVGQFVDLALDLARGLADCLLGVVGKLAAYLLDVAAALPLLAAEALAAAADGGGLVGARGAAGCVAG